MVMADPRKNYGKFMPSSESSPTLLSTDYKSPHLVMEATRQKMSFIITHTAEKLHIIATASYSKEVGVTLNPDLWASLHELHKGKEEARDYETRFIERAVRGVHKKLGTQTSFRIRKLTPRECYRLMDMPEENIDRLLASGISKSQHYKLAGNSIVVACLYHIFKNLFTNEIPQNQQLSLF